MLHTECVGVSAVCVCCCFENQLIFSSSFRFNIFILRKQCAIFIFVFLDKDWQWTNRRLRCARQSKRSRFSPIAYTAHYPTLTLRSHTHSRTRTQKSLHERIYWRPANPHALISNRCLSVAAATAAAACLCDCQSDGMCTPSLRTQTQTRISRCDCVTQATVIYFYI